MPGSEGVTASTQKPRCHGSAQGISPSKDPRDDDDPVILGMTQQGDGMVCNLQRLCQEQEKDPVISLVTKRLLSLDLRHAFGRNTGIPKWYRRKRDSLAVINGILYQKRKEGNEFIVKVVPSSMVSEILESCDNNDVDHVGDDGENAVSFDKCDNFDVRVDDNALRMIKTLVILWMIAMSVQMSMLMMTLTVSKKITPIE